MSLTARCLRIGKIKYTNVWPIFYYLPDKAEDGSYELIHQVPSLLNRAMAAGEVDMGPISSFAYAEAYPNYVLYPDLSVSALGKVKSILLFHRKPLKEIRNGLIALPSTSASSSNLLRIIMSCFYDGQPVYSVEEPNLERMMEGKDAALLIGDDAIRGGWNNNKYLVTDLGEQWYKFTGMWMSFAVWAIRKDTLLRYADELDLLFHNFLSSKRRSLQEPGAMIAEAIARVGGDERYWREYFGNLSYDFGPMQHEGLETYFRYAKQLGLLKQDVKIELWSHNTAVKVNE
ncbi:MAG: transporter substrate-binding protein [Paenibacillaceae bacterium]|jgi:chorismate dehydratase|nr:transporter substrate-binding protein [Paenibacillaceae bacterium]